MDSMTVSEGSAPLGVHAHARRRFHLILVLTTGICIAALSPVGPSAWAQPPFVNSLYPAPLVTTLIPDEDYLRGFLSWSPEGGLISWSDGQVPETPPGGPGSSGLADDIQTNTRGWAGWQLRSNTAGQSGNEFIRRIVFSAEPLPKDVFLNASRPIQVGIYFNERPTASATTTGSSRCASFDVELHVDGEFIGGAVDMFRNHPSAIGGKPGPAAGLCLQLARIHPETDVLRAGQKLALELIQVASPHDGPLQFSFAEPFTSTIDVPGYPQEEALSRFPEFSAKPSGGALGGPPNLAGAAILALAGIGSRGRGRRGLVFVATAAWLAGCSAPASTLGPGQDAHDLEPADVRMDYMGPIGSEAANGSAAILVTVSDAFDRYVAGARVTLQRTAFQAMTNQYGRIVFEGVPGGDYTLRIDHDDFHSAETPVAPKEGKTLRLTVQLEFRDPDKAGFPPHRHPEYWPPSGEKVIFEGDVPVVDETAAGASGGFALCAAHPMVNLVFFSKDPVRICYADFAIPNDPLSPSLVSPGTRTVEVRISWTDVNAAALRIERAGIAFQPADGAHPNNHTWMYPRAQGEPTRIAVNWEMADPAHQPFSSWRWRLYFPVGKTESRLGGLGWIPDTYQAAAWAIPTKVHVAITLQRGIVPLDPPHPDFWRGRDSVVVVPNSTRESLEWNPGATLVPPGTSWLNVTLQKAEAARVDYVLRYRTADMPAETNTGIAYKRAHYKKAEPIHEADRHLFFHIPLEPHETDPQYAKRSGFNFVADAVDPCEGIPDAGPLRRSDLAETVGCPFRHPASLPADLGVVAHRA